jgi:hypothetical protein
MVEPVPALRLIEPRIACLLRQATALGVVNALLASPCTAADGSGPCSEETIGFDSGRVVCILEASAHLRRMRLMVRFGGVHDDSEASLRVDLDGAPVACAPDDKVVLSGQLGDEGDVTLACTLEIAPADGQRHELRATLAFHHALYSGATLHAP